MEKISQLVKKLSLGAPKKVFPKTFLLAIVDEYSGRTLADILSDFNMYQIAYTGSVTSTRNSVPMPLRRLGLWITYVKYDGTTITERYESNEVLDSDWSKDSNWRNSIDLFGGTIEIGANGNWYINGIDTGKTALGSIEYPTLFIFPSMHLYVIPAPSTVDFNLDKSNGHLTIERDISDILDLLNNN